MILTRSFGPGRRPVRRSERQRPGAGAVVAHPATRLLAPAMLLLGGGAAQALAPSMAAAQAAASPASPVQSPFGAPQRPTAPDSASLSIAITRRDSAAGMGLTGPLSAVLGETGLSVYEIVPEQSDDVRSVVEHAVAHMNFITRPIARRRLLRANRMSPQLTFAVSVDTIAVTFDGLNPIVTPRDGNAVAWMRGRTGERYDVWIAQAGDTLRQVIHTDDGQRKNDFVFLDGGSRVELHVELTADRLPAPLHYTLSFRRVL